MILGKKSLTYGLIGLFCVSVVAGEKEQKKSASIIERYWLMRNVVEEHGCPPELNQEISHIACKDDMTKIRELKLSLKRLNDYGLISAMERQIMEKRIFELNEQQQEGLSYLIQNRRNKKEVFTKAQYEKMKTVPSVLKIALGKQCADVKIPSDVVRKLDRLEHLMYIPLLSIAGGMFLGGGALCFNQFFHHLSAEAENNAYETIRVGASAGALLGAAWFSMNEVDCIGYKFPDGRMRMQLFEQPRLLELDKGFMKELRDREKKWERSMVLKE